MYLTTLTITSYYFTNKTGKTITIQPVKAGGNFYSERWGDGVTLLSGANSSNNAFPALCATPEGLPCHPAINNTALYSITDTSAHAVIGNITLAVGPISSQHAQNTVTVRGASGEVSVYTATPTGACTVNVVLKLPVRSLKDAE